MSEKTSIEAVPEEPEIADENLPVAVDQSQMMEGDMMDSMIAVSQKVDRYQKAMATIIGAIMKTAYAGDWVSHDRADTKVHLRTASPSGPGCERIASFLGINEQNWSGGEKFWVEEGKHYGFRYEADFILGGRRVRGFGEGTTKNKFFSYANQQWKELTDVREDHIRKAAQRECLKDGVKKLLGLRKIPLTKLRDLGFSLDLVHFVNFQNAKAALTGPGNAPAPEPTAAKPAAAPPAAKPAESAKPAEEKPKDMFESTFTPTKFEHKENANKVKYTQYTDELGGLFSCFRPPEDPVNQSILEAHRDGNRVRVEHKTTEKDGKVYRNIVNVMEVIKL